MDSNLEQRIKTIEEWIENFDDEWTAWTPTDPGRSSLPLPSERIPKLIEVGAIDIGTKVTSNYKASTATATVTKTGLKLRGNKKSFSPGAAFRVAHRPDARMDGWTYWKTDKGKSLLDLAYEYLVKAEPTGSNNG